MATKQNRIEETTKSGKKNELQPTDDKSGNRECTIALLGTNLFYEIPIKAFRVTRKLAHKRKFNLLYFSGGAYQSTEHFFSQANILYDMISPRIADGMIIISNLLNTFVSHREFRKRCLQFHPLPLVSVGMAMEGIPSIVLDNMSGMYDAVCHLIEVHQYSRIAFLHGPRQHSDAMDRFAAFKKAMETHDLPVDESLLLQGNFLLESGTAAVKELIDNRGKIPGKDVQAIVCCNDYMASGVMLELQRRGIMIPDQIAVTGFDDIYFTENLIPPLSTVHHPFQKITAKATEILLSLIEGKTVPDVVSVGTHFIPRCSCGCPDGPERSDILPFTEDLERLLKSSYNHFPEDINRQLIKSERPTLITWKQALTHLRLEGKLDLISCINNPPEQSQTNCKEEKKHLKENTLGPQQKSEDYIHERTIGPHPSFKNHPGDSNQRAWEFLGRIAYATFHSANYQTMTYNMGSALTSTLELSELLNILAKQLPEAKMERCCVCLYENPADFPGSLPPWSRLIFSLSEVGLEKLPPDGLRFATKSLLPAETIRKQGRNSWVIQPLYFKEEQLGYMLMDSEAPHEHLHWNMCNQISSALKGVRLLAETRKANNLLREANEQKTQFFINIAHETKTPLTLIKNYLSLYIEQHQPNEHLSIIEQNIDMLLKNMLNFLDVEKLQKGNTIYQHNTLVDLSESAEKKSALFRVLAIKKNISIIVNVEKNILIRIDTLALDRIFNNLLDNAVKYIQPGGRIKVDVKRKEDKAILRISDNGPGLPGETFDHIFEPYYLLSQKKTSKQGIGVGLSIVKKIIDGMGAGISVKKCRGGGVCFTISFIDNSTTQEQDTIQKIPDTAPDYLVNAVIKERNISAEKSSLLIVDDNVQLLQFMQESLEKKYNVFLARNVPDALFKLKSIHRPDLIISDIMMDGADGFTLLEEISKMQGYSDIPYIFLTAMSGEKERLKGLGLGAVDYIEKPFSIPEICAKIDSFITMRKRKEKQDIEYIKNRIQGIFSGIEQNINDSPKKNFNAMCKRYGVRGREPAIIKLLLKGFINKEIAAKLNISLRTVEYHISKIYKKCNVKNRYELISIFQD